MPDTKLSGLGPATLPLAASNQIAVLQGGQAKLATIGAVTALLGQVGGFVDPTNLIAISNATIPENSPQYTVIGQLSVVSALPGTWRFTLLSNLGGRVYLTGNYRQFLTCSDIPLNYEASPTVSVQIQADRLEDGRQVVEWLTLTLVDVLEGGPAADLDYNLVTQSFTGGTIADLGLTLGDLAPRGYKVNGRTIYYDAPNSMNPSGAGWTNSESGAGLSYSVLSPVVTTDGVFTPIRLNDQGYGNGRQCNGVRVMAVGETVRVRVRLKPVAGGTDGGYVIGFGGAVNQQIFAASTAASAAPPRTGVDTGVYFSALGIVFRGKTVHPDGSFTVDYLITAKNAAALRVKLRAATNGNFDIYGIQIRSFDEAADWVSTGATGVTVAATNPILTGAGAAALASGTFTIMIESHTGAHQKPYGLLACGSGGGTDVLKAPTYGEVAAGPVGSVKATVGTGGFLGITRVCLAQSGAGYSLYVNDGKVGASNTPLSITGAIHLLKGTIGYLRRVSIWTSRQTDAAAKDLSSLANRTLQQTAGALVPGFGRTYHEQDFEDRASSIAYRGGNAQAYSQASYEAGVFKYDAAYNNPATSRAMIGRYVFWDGYLGSHLQTINGEEQLYLDPELFHGPSTNKPNWGGYEGPIKFDPVNFPSCMGIEAKLVSELPPEAQALIPNRQINQGTAANNYKWKVVSAALTSAGRAEIGVGSFWTSRIKFPTGDRFWGAFWNLDGSRKTANYYSRNEYDIQEVIGQYPSEHRMAAHAQSYSKNENLLYDIGFNYSDDFHTWEMIWRPGQLIMGISGLISAVFDTSTWSNADAFPMYYLLNFAVGGSYPGPITNQTLLDLAGGKTMWVDFVRLLALDSLAPVLAPLTISSTTASVNTAFSATVGGGTGGSTRVLFSPVDGTVTYNPTTGALTGLWPTSGAKSIVIIETNPDAVPPRRATTFTVTVT